MKSESTGMMETPLYHKIQASAQYIISQGVADIRLAMILGTGFGRFVEHLDTSVVLPYRDIPHFPVSTVADHAGNLVGGSMGDTQMLIMQGRFHRYEGYTPDIVTYPVRVMKQLGVDLLVVTNAAGGLNPFFSVGDLMLIDDHIDMVGGVLKHDPKLKAATKPPYYNVLLSSLAEKTACEQQLLLQRGVIASMLGPSFETPAEIAMLRQIGADAVTMSTVPEVVMANALHMNVLGFSCISNLCVGLKSHTIKHEDVMAVVHSAGERFSRLMRHLIPQIMSSHIDSLAINRV